MLKIKKKTGRTRRRSNKRSVITAGEQKNNLPNYNNIRPENYENTSLYNKSNYPYNIYEYERNLNNPDDVPQENNESNYFYNVYKNTRNYFNPDDVRNWPGSDVLLFYNRIQDKTERQHSALYKLFYDALHNYNRLAGTQNLLLFDRLKQIYIIEKEYNKVKEKEMNFKQYNIFSNEPYNSNDPYNYYFPLSMYPVNESDIFVDLDLSNKNLKEFLFPIHEKNINSIDLKNNHLTTIPPLPESLSYINLDNNPLIEPFKSFYEKYKKRIDEVPHPESDSIHTITLEFVRNVNRTHLGQNIETLRPNLPSNLAQHIAKFVVGGKPRKTKRKQI